MSQQQQSIIQTATNTTPLSTKSNIIDANDDDNDEEVVNFGADTSAVDGNGWDDADDIYDDDDDDDDDDEDVQLENAKVEQEELSHEEPGSNVVPLETTIETTQPSPSIDETALNQMMEMGCSINGSKRALLAVGGSDVEAAMNWVFEHSDDPEFNDPLPEEESEQIQATMQDSSEEMIQEVEQERVFEEDTTLTQVDDIADVQPPPQDDYNDSIPTSRPSPLMDDADVQRYLRTISDLELQLQQREEQLASKSDMIASLSEQHESELHKLREVVSETKEEAKKRIIKAKERVEEMQTKLNDATRRADAAAGSGQGQSEVINELRAEGEKLARKQGEMEQLVRKARGEVRDLEERLEIEKAAHEKEVMRADNLEKEVKSLKDGLSSARKGESQSKKLEGELMTAKEETEKQRASNMVLEQQLKELKAENKSLKKDVEEARAGAALELQGESNKLRRERDDMLSDLEGKLRTSEREANVREDALRHEVSELRKRWQDAVRRAEGTSTSLPCVCFFH
jgi:chromosome segregation ATPase